MSLAAQEWDCPSPCCVSKVGQSLLEREASGASAKRTSACGANPSTLMCSSLLMAFQGCIRDFCNVNCISGHHKSPRVGSSGPGGGWWAWFGRMMGKELQSVARGVLGFGNCSLCPAARVPQHTGPKCSSQGSEKLLKSLTLKLFCLKKHSSAKGEKECVSLVPPAL